MKRNEGYTGFGMGKGAAYTIEEPGELIYCGDNYALWKPFPPRQKTVTAGDGWVTLRLTPEEADTLAAILGKVGGSPEQSPRKHAESIDTKLMNNGYSFANSAAFRLLDRGRIRFNEWGSDD